MASVDTLDTRVKQVLEAAFPAPDRVRVDDDDGIIAVVVSSRFLGLDSMDRQDMVWPSLEAALDPSERRQIAIVVTVTPQEDAVYSTARED